MVSKSQQWINFVVKSLCRRHSNVLKDLYRQALLIQDRVNDNYYSGSTCGPVRRLGLSGTETLHVAHHQLDTEFRLQIGCHITND